MMCMEMEFIMMMKATRNEIELLIFVALSVNEDRLLFVLCMYHTRHMIVLEHGYQRQSAISRIDSYIFEDAIFCLSNPGASA